MTRSCVSLLIFIVILLMIFVLIHNTLLPLFFSLAEAEAVKIANRAINEAVDKQIKDIDYEKLINYRLDNNGNIVLMQPNTGEINKFSSRVSLAIQSKLEQVTRKKVAIPLLKIIGLDILSALGPDINARIIPVGFTTPPQVKDSFESAGINQTRHKIYLQIGVKMKLIIPFSSKITTVKADVPVVEVTILGEVPKVYVGLNGNDLSGILGGNK